jgi:hypothetical protein
MIDACQYIRWLTLINNKEVITMTMIDIAGANDNHLEDLTLDDIIAAELEAKATAIAWAHEEAVHAGAAYSKYEDDDPSDYDGVKSPY